MRRPASHYGQGRSHTHGGGSPTSESDKRFKGHRRTTVAGKRISPPPQPDERRNSCNPSPWPHKLGPQSNKEGCVTTTYHIDDDKL